MQESILRSRLEFTYKYILSGKIKSMPKAIDAIDEHAKDTMSARIRWYLLPDVIWFSHLN